MGISNKTHPGPKTAAQEKPLANPDKEFGEGNYRATRDYNQATRRFVESGKVEAAAKAAKPANDVEARELEQAEKRGRAKRKDEDPALRRKQNRDR